MKPLALPVRTLHRSGLGKIHPLGHPASRAVGKRGRLDELPAHLELPAEDAEPAVLRRLFLLRQALHLPLNDR